MSVTTVEIIKRNNHESGDDCLLCIFVCNHFGVVDHPDTSSFCTEEPLALYRFSKPNPHFPTMSCDVYHTAGPHTRTYTDNPDAAAEYIKHLIETVYRMNPIPPEQVANFLGLKFHESEAW